MSRVPTAPVAAASFIGSWAVVEVSGSRTLGGAVLAAGGLWCLGAWAKRHDRRTAATLGAYGFGAFVVSHLIGLLVGSWPAVLIVSAAMAWLAWLKADSRERGRIAPARRAAIR